MDRGTRLKDRYELGEPLGQGGMGVVYRAYDAVLKCDVALKTIREAPDRTALQLFYRECEALVKLNHPNIVPILDIGEFEEQGIAKPYFVMPLLSGMPLDKLIRAAGTRLTTERRVEILSQVCRGLNAAHERGLVHRDLKPANVFVMPDYSAVIIDFGIAHMVTAGMTGQKGTLHYMAPELIEGKPPSPASDIFALGVMAFEVFTRRRPFEGPTEREIVEAILRKSPPGACDVDPTVNQSVSRVIHKAMARQPWHRFGTAREFAECLEKAHRGEAIEYFDSARLAPRIQRAKTTLAQGDTQFALEIIDELEAEGHLDPELKLLRMRIDAAVRQERVRRLLEAARSRFEVEEYPLALQKIQETLELDPGNTEALGLRAKIESARSEAQIESWFRLARQHAENWAFGQAREALQNILQIRPQDTRATGLLSEIERREQEYRRSLREKERLYQAAVEAHQKGDLSSAIAKLEQAIEMDRRAPESQGRANVYQSFYNDVRSEYEAAHTAGAIAGQSGAPEPSRAPAAALEGVPGPQALRPGRGHPRNALIAAITALALAGSLTSWLLLRHRAAWTRLEHKPVADGTAVRERTAAPALGELHIKVPPASAKVTYGRAGEAPQPAPSSTLNLEEGAYVLSGRAPGYSEGSVTVPITAGVTQTAELKLTPVKPIVRPPVVFQMDPEDWEKPWTRDGEWFTRRGGDFVLYRRTPTAGSFQFTLRAKSKVEWVLDYSDPQNYLLFEINKQTFTLSQYANNRRLVIVDQKRFGVKTDYFMVNLVVEPTRVVTMLVDEQGKPVTLQDWNRPDQPFTRGRFGIYVPGNSQVWLANFRFTQVRPG